MIVQVRIDAPTETVARQAADQMGVQVNRVKGRDDCVQLYGSKLVATVDCQVVSNNWELIPRT